MLHTDSLKRNGDFKRLYARGKNAVDGCAAVYTRKNGTLRSRLGVTVSTKHGGAVVRNRVRRRIREAYRINEHRFPPGYDIVIVARIRAGHVSFGALCSSVTALILKLTGH